MLDLSKKTQEILDNNIPTFTKETAESLDKKVPGWMDYLLGTQYIPTQDIKPKKKRGRPQVHNLPAAPKGTKVNKLSDDIPICPPLSKPLIQELVKKYNNSVGTPREKFQYLSDMYRLPYKSIQKAISKSVF